MKRPPTILVVDDEPLMRLLLESLLQRVGLAVIHANDAAEAIERAKAELPDLIVSNIEMPGMDGYELLQVIRALPETARIPFVIWTGYPATEELVKKAFDYGANDYIVKPGIDVVLPRIQNVLCTNRDRSIGGPTHLLRDPSQP
jgi:CheY-like chemotaxis protein